MAKTREIVGRAMKDPNFRDRLVKDPKTAIEKEFDIQFPKDVTINVHQNTPTVINLVLPAPIEATERAFSEEELQQVAGGATTKPIMALDTIKCPIKW